MILYDSYSRFPQFYKKEVRLEEGIEVSELFSGKGATFTVKQDDDFSAPVVPKSWDTTEITSVGIDPDIHNGVRLLAVQVKILL